MKENLITKRDKIIKLCKIKLNYGTKLKYNVIEGKIRKKTLNLT